MHSEWILSPRNIFYFSPVLRVIYSIFLDAHLSYKCYVVSYYYLTTLCLFYKCNIYCMSFCPKTRIPSLLHFLRLSFPS